MYPEMICSVILFIMGIILFAAWAGLLDKWEKLSDRTEAVENRYNALLQGLRDSGYEIEFYEEGVKPSGRKSSDSEDGAIVAAVVVTPPGII